MIISLWSGPRNVSTALMYSFAQRRDIKVIDEPLYGYYLEVTGAMHPGREDFLPLIEKDPFKVIANIKSQENGKGVFVKNMAHHLVDLDHKFLRDYANIFLIREPDQMLLSLIKQIPEPTLLDTAYEMQYDLFNELKTSETPIPLVLDSAYLLKDPEHILRQTCEALDLDWDPSMLHWNAGPLPEDGPWAHYWYKQVHQSTGFEPYSRKNEQVPDRLISLLEKCKDYYNELSKYAIR